MLSHFVLHEIHNRSYNYRSHFNLQDCISFASLTLYLSLTLSLSFRFLSLVGSHTLGVYDTKLTNSLKQKVFCTIQELMLVPKYLIVCSKFWYRLGVNVVGNWMIIIQQMMYCYNAWTIATLILLYYGIVYNTI